MSAVTALETALEAKHGAEAFEKVCETISEMMWSRQTSDGQEGEDGAVYIADQQMVDACNHIATASFWLRGTEYSFEVANGNNAGFVFYKLSADAPIPTIEIRRTEWDVAPAEFPLLEDKQQAERFIWKWRLFRKRADVRQMLGAYAYDRMFQPGTKIEGHYRDKAAKLGMRITSKEAVEERERLIAGQCDVDLSRIQS
jgi:hypothetical protein